MSQTAEQSKIPPSPPLEKGGGVKGMQVLARAVAVVEFLGSGELNDWRSIREVAAAAGLPESAAYRILETLTACLWVDKSPQGKGYRIGGEHLVGWLVEMQKCYLAKLKQFGVDI